MFPFFSSVATLSQAAVRQLSKQSTLGKFVINVTELNRQYKTKPHPTINNV